MTHAYPKSGSNSLFESMNPHPQTWEHQHWRAEHLTDEQICLVQKKLCQKTKRHNRKKRPKFPPNVNSTHCCRLHVPRCKSAKWCECSAVCSAKCQISRGTYNQDKGRIHVQLRSLGMSNIHPPTLYFCLQLDCPKLWKLFLSLPFLKTPI